MDQHADPSSVAALQRVTAGLESAGLEPQSEYANLKRLAADVKSNGGILADADVDRALALLESTPEAIVRSVVMVMLAELGPGLLTQGQRDKIRGAIAPLLNSERKLDQLSAAFLERTLAATTQ